MARRTLAAVAALALATLAACSSSSGDDDSEGGGDCTTASQAMLDQVADGLSKQATVERGELAPIPSDDQSFNYQYLLAVELKDANGSTDAVLATGTTTAGPILAVDHVAQLYFNWGAAATDGSKIDQWRDSLSTSKALGCL